MDFSPRNSSIRPAKTPFGDGLPEPMPAPGQKLVTSRSQAGHGTKFVWVIIVIILAIGVLTVWEFLKPSSVTNKVSPITTTAPGSAPAAANNLLATKSSLPLIQVYDSGAGADAVAKEIATLKALGYTAENLEKSQFNYDKTYIWYQAGLEAEATKIASTMPSRVVELKETKIAGSFNILILLGTK